MPKEIVVVAGHCSALSEVEVMDLGYKLRKVQDVVAPYRIKIEQRDGIWKPRTESQSSGKRNFEGVGPGGLLWLAKAAKEFELSMATEIMYAGDLVHFFHSLDPLRDTAWVGARDSMNYALLAYLGLSPFNIMIKNPLHGVLPVEAKGSLDRITYPTDDENIVTDYKNLSRPYPKSRIENPNRRIVYCIRGQSWPISPDGKIDELQRKKLLERKYQHHGSRNVNNIESLHVLRQQEYFQEHEILFFFDPSHVFGGAGNKALGITPNQMRKLIGEYAIKAITEFGYDGLLIEVHDTSATAKTDKDQALVTTHNGIYYSQTNMGKKPSKDEMPLSLVDIIKALMEHQAARGEISVHNEQLMLDHTTLDKIRWDMNYR